MKKQFLKVRKRIAEPRRFFEPTYIFPKSKYERELHRLASCQRSKCLHKLLFIGLQIRIAIHNFNIFVTNNAFVSIIRQQHFHFITIWTPTLRVDDDFLRVWAKRHNIINKKYNYMMI